MALTLDSTGSGSDNTADTTFSWSHTCTGTELVLIVTVNVNGTTTVSGITYNGVALTFIGGVNNIIRSEMWYLIAPATGTNTVAVTMNAGVAKIGGSQSYTGASQTAPIGTFVSATGNSTAPTVNVNTAVGEGCIDVMTCGNLTATVGANQTQNYNILLGVGLRGTQSTEPSNSTPITMSWTLSGAGGVWAIGAVNVLPPAAPVDVDTMSWRPTYPNMIDHWRTYEIVGSGNASS